jgi:hypothetical protein
MTQGKLLAVSPCKKNFKNQVIYFQHTLVGQSTHSNSKREELELRKER